MAEEKSKKKDSVSKIPDVVFFAGDGEKLNKLVIIGDFETKNEIRLPQGFEMLTYDKKDSFLDNFTSTK